MPPRFLRVTNWDRYQHYKNRTPPWIKLYNSLLDDHAFCSLPDATKAHFLCILLAASRHENRIPLDGEWLGRFMHATETIDLKLLCEVGLLAPCTRSASKMLATCKQSAIPERETETEREEETDTPKPPRASRSRVFPVGFSDAWSSYPHYQTRSSRKKSAQVWEKLGLEAHVETVIAWIDASASSKDWERDGGRFVPAMEVWLGKVDVSAPPPKPELPLYVREIEPELTPAEQIKRAEEDWRRRRGLSNA